MSPRTKTANEQLKQKTRQSIVEAAFTLFAERGYAQTSMTLVAQRAGISKGLIYHYFQSKQELLLGIFHFYKQQGAQQLAWDESDSAAQKLRKLIELNFSYLTDQPQIRKFSFQIALQAEVVEGLKKAIEQNKGYWEKQMHEIFRALGYAEPELESIKLTCLMDGIALRYLSVHDYPLARMKQLIFKEYGLL